MPRLTISPVLMSRTVKWARAAGPVLAAVNRAVAPDGHWRAVAARLMKTALIVKGEIFADSGFRLAAIGVALQIDVLIFERAPDAFDEDVVHPAAAPAHRDAHAGLEQRAGEDG